MRFKYNWCIKISKLKASPKVQFYIFIEYTKEFLKSFLSYIEPNFFKLATRIHFCFRKSKVFGECCFQLR